jgi:hypothetical protein
VDQIRDIAMDKMVDAIKRRNELKGKDPIEYTYWAGMADGYAEMVNEIIDAQFEAERRA